MKHVLCFIYDTCVDFEISLACHYINSDEEYKIIYVAYENSPVKNLEGMTLIPDKTLSEISSTTDIYGLIIPGGVERVLRPELESLIRNLINGKKLVAAICAGPEFLAKMSILNDKKYTCSMEPHEYEVKGEKDPFPRENYIETRVVRDKNIITAKGNAFVDFALEIWDWFDLYEYETEKDETKILFSPS